MDFDIVSVHKNAKKGLSQYPAILTSHLVNNAYLLQHFCFSKTFSCFKDHLGFSRLLWVQNG